MKAAAFIIATPGENIDSTLESIKRHAPQLNAYRVKAMLPQSEVNAGMNWNWPNHGTATLFGLRCHAYSGDVAVRKAIFLSHAILWRECADSGCPMVILESDAVFTRDFKISEIAGAGALDFGLISLNDPRGATRRADRYHAALQQAKSDGATICECPWVDDRDIPQGPPGMSAYAIHPDFAQRLLDTVKEIGARPNDALAIKQLFPGMIGCLTNYATKTSGRRSTVAR